MTSVKAMFEAVFHNSLASEFVIMINSKPHEIWDEIDNAFTTVTLNKSSTAVRKLTNFNRNPEEGIRHFLLRMEGARKRLKEVYGHKVSDLEMIPRFESALSGDTITSFIT